MLYYTTDYRSNDKRASVKGVNLSIIVDALSQVTL